MNESPKCIYCNQEFESTAVAGKVQKICSNECRKKYKIKQLNAEPSKEKKKQLPRCITHSKYETSHCNKQTPKPWLKKFKAVRG